MRLRDVFLASAVLGMALMAGCGDQRDGGQGQGRRWQRGGDDRQGGAEGGQGVQGEADKVGGAAEKTTEAVGKGMEKAGLESAGKSVRVRPTRSAARPTRPPPQPARPSRRPARPSRRPARRSSRLPTPRPPPSDLEPDRSTRGRSAQSEHPGAARTSCQRNEPAPLLCAYEAASNHGAGAVTIVSSHGANEARFQMPDSRFQIPVTTQSLES